METQLLASIARKDGSTPNDAKFKELLAYREVLAHIMKTCVTEYRDCTIHEIMDCIEGDIQVSDSGVHPDETNRPPRIQGLSAESSTVTEGSVFYDVRFSAVSPWEGGRIGLIINVEAQTRYNNGYPLVKRALYYCSRMISAQYGAIFDHSHYEKIRKVYSIWICKNPPEERRNTITSYTIQEHHLVGEARELVRNYDLLNATMVCMGKPDDENYDGLLRLLDVLFGTSHKKEQAVDILENEYGFTMTDELERKVLEVCNFSQGYIEEGLAKGRAEGRAEGREEERLHIIRSLMNRLLLPAEEVMTMIEIPEEEQPRYLKLLELPN